MPKIKKDIASLLLLIYIRSLWNDARSDHNIVLCINTIFDNSGIIQGTTLFIISYGRITIFPNKSYDINECRGLQRVYLHQRHTIPR